MRIHRDALRVSHLRKAQRQTPLGFLHWASLNTLLKTTGGSSRVSAPDALRSREGTKVSSRHDREANLYSKWGGRPEILPQREHALTENRHGLAV